MRNYGDDAALQYAVDSSVIAGFPDYQFGSTQNSPLVADGGLCLLSPAAVHFKVKTRIHIRDVRIVRVPRHAGLVSGMACPGTERPAPVEST
jgi:hypothetical protein